MTKKKPYTVRLSPEFTATYNALPKKRQQMIDEAIEQIRQNPFIGEESKPCPNCGAYFFHSDKQCPFCGFKLAKR